MPSHSPAQAQARRLIKMKVLPEIYFVFSGMDKKNGHQEYYDNLELWAKIEIGRSREIYNATSGEFVLALHGNFFKLFE